MIISIIVIIIMFTLSIVMIYYLAGRTKEKQYNMNII